MATWSLLNTLQGRPANPSENRSSPYEIAKVNNSSVFVCVVVFVVVVEKNICV